MTTNFNNTEDVLIYIATNFGADVLKDGDQCVAYFLDLAPYLSREAHLLTSFYKCGGQSLDPNGNRTALVRAFRNVVDRMVREHSVVADAAISICNCYIRVLGGSPVSLEDSANKTNVVPARKKRLAIIMSAVILLCAVIGTITFSLKDSQNTKAPNGEASVINGEKDETDRLFSTGYPEVMVGDAVFATDSSGVHVFTGEHKETIYAGNLLFGKNICTDGQTVYAIDSGNNIIEIDVNSRNAKTLFNLSGDIDIEGVSEGKIYMSYLSNEEAAGIAAGGDFAGYDLNIYDFDGYQIGEIESGGTMEMTAGLLVVEEPAPLGSDFPCKIYSGEELLLDEYNVCDVMAVSGKVYYLLPGESSDSAEIHQIDQSGDHTIATLNVSNANGYGFYKHDAGVYSGLVATGGRLVWTADHYYDITSGNEVPESTIIPSVEEAWGFVVEDEYTHQRYYVSYSEYGTDGTMTVYSYSSNKWVTVSQVQHASFVCIYKSTLYYSKQQTTEGSTIATIAAESIK